MKRTLRLVGVAAMMLLLAASCKKEEKNNGETRKVTFTAGIEQGGGAKTGLTPNDQDPHVFNQVWKEGDKISINGNVFELEKGAETSSGNFTGEVALSDHGPYYAFYPAPVETQQRGDQDFSKVTFEIPESQVYAEKSYATNLAPMAAKATDKNLSFTNLCGLMELSLVGDDITVTGLELSCDKPIWGQTKEYTIGGGVALEMAEGAGEPITMDCGEGVTLDGTTSFIFVLPPVDKGKFSLKVNYKKGVESNVFVETIDLKNMEISIKASEVSYNNTAYEIGTVTTKGINESGASVEATTATILYTVDNMDGYRMSESGVCYGVNENPDLTGSHQTGSRASSYTASLSGLSPNTHYYARAYAKYSPVSKDGSDVVVYGNQIDFYTQSIGGTVTTDDVISFTATGASLGYSVEPNDYSQATQHGICYSTSQNPVYTGSHVSGTGQSPYTVSVSSLTPNKTYYYRAYAIFAVASKDEPEVVYGEEKSFTTLSIGGTVTTGDVDDSSITATGASLGYSVAPNTGSQATQHGICYSTSQNPVYTGSHVSGTGQSPYTVSVSSLNANTTYYYRAYAIFAVASKDEPEVVYGEEKSFTTQSIGGTVTTGNVSSITTTGASVGYTFAPNGYSRATQHGVYYSTSQNPVATGSPVEGPDSSPYSVSLTGLNASTTYYVRAYAVFGPASKDGNSVTVYGEEKSFTTKPETPTTASATIEEVRLGTNGFWVRGAISGTSGDAEVGICYSKTNPTPTYADGHSTINTSATSFSVDVPKTKTDGILEINTQYYYRTYIKYNGGVAYGTVQTLTTESDYHSSGPGTVSETYYFSVSPTKKVVFSKGNLQYNAGLNEWRFAEHQYDVVSDQYNTAPHANYPVWTDLFVYGTSGFDNAPSHQPWYCGTENVLATSLTGNKDWGYNKIVNGGNVNGQWHTMTREEFGHLIGCQAYDPGWTVGFRANASSKRGCATVNGRPGLVILPDNWPGLPSGCSFTPTDDNGAFTANQYSASQWASMEARGAVFLPVSTMRMRESTFYDWDTGGCWGQEYWLNGVPGSGRAYRFMLHDGDFGLPGSSTSYYAMPVRLVKYIN